MKPPNTPEGAEQQARRGTKLPRSKVQAFRSLCRQRGHIGANLCYGWLWIAVTRAALDLPLPPKGTQPTNSEPRDGLLWSQGKDEYATWAAALDGAGSSVRDVIGQLVDLYLATEGDLRRAAVLAAQDVVPRAEVDRMVAEATEQARAAFSGTARPASDDDVPGPRLAAQGPDGTSMLLAC